MKKKEKPSKVPNVDNELIRLQSEDWESKFTENNARGKEMIDFISCGKQWPMNTAETRQTSNKESLTLNICRKEQKKLFADNAKIGYSLDVHPTTREAKNNVEETHTFSVLMNNILLTKDLITAIKCTFEKSASFGYAFGEINFQRISDKDLSMYPVYIPHKDPRIGFWDINALKSTKIDGKYCGIKRHLSRCELLKKIPGISEKKCNITDNDNCVIDYWFRCEEEATYCLLMSGVYKQKDMLTFDEKNNLMDRERISALKSSGEIDEGLELEKKGMVDKIYFKRICNWIDIVAPTCFPTTDLPLPYHGAFTIWTPDKPFYTIPFGYELKGAQKLLNFVNSQIATQVKNSSSTKWFFKPEHVKTQQQQLMAQEINKREGGMTFGGNPAEIVRHDPVGVAPSLLQMSQNLKMIVDDINGVAMNQQENPMVSGEAVKRIINSLRDVNRNVLDEHEIFFNDVGKIIGQMLPNIVTEERVMVIKKLDGTSDALVVNEQTATGEIRNNIKDIRNKFEYEIKAGMNDEDKRESTVNNLKAIYAINPQLLADTADVYFRNLDCKDSAELSRRASIRIDQNLIKYSQGEITQEEYMQAQQLQQQQAEQAKIKALQSDPTYQSNLALANSEGEKAKAAQKDSDTKRIDALGKIINTEHANDIKLAELLLKSDAQDAQNALDTIKSNMQLNDQMIDRMREVIGDNDMALQGDTEPGAPNAKGGENPDQSPDSSQGGNENAAESDVPAS